MTAATDYLELKLLDHVFGGTSYTSPTNVFLALFTAAPNDAGGGTEVSGNGYARDQLSFGAAADGTIASNADAVFTASGGDFGTITSWGIFDALTGGNLLTYGTLTSENITDGNTYTVPSGDVTISIA